MRIRIICLFLLMPLFAFPQHFYSWDHIQEIKLEFDSENWSKKLNMLKVQGKKNRMRGHVSINGKDYKHVGVRYKGNSSFKNVKKSGTEKLPFNIKLNYTTKGQKVEDQYETLKLSNGFREPSYVREVLSYEIARKYMPASECNFAKLYVNGDYIGLYNNVESVNEEFLKKHFKYDKGTFVKCDPDWKAQQFKDCQKGDKASLMYLGDDIKCYLGKYELKSEKGWDDFTAFLKVLKEQPNEIEEYLDVNQALWMLAFNNVLVNLDSYTGRLSHNFYMFQNKSGQFTPILWDMNLSFGGFRYDGIRLGMDNEAMQTMSPLVHFKQNNSKRPLIVNLLKKELYRKMYIAHIKTILEENFSNGLYLERAKQIQDLVAMEVKNDPNKLYDIATFKSNLNETVVLDKTPIIGLSELMEGRTRYLSAHPLLNEAAPEIIHVEDNHFGPTVGISAKAINATAAWLYYRMKPNETFRRKKMWDDGGHNDEMLADGVWGTTLKFKKGIEYFIVMESEGAAKCSPRRAGKAFYTVKE